MTGDDDLLAAMMVGVGIDVLRRPWCGSLGLRTGRNGNLPLLLVRWLLSQCGSAEHC